MKLTVLGLINVCRNFSNSIASFENSVNQDQLASMKPVNQDPHN